MQFDKLNRRKFITLLGGAATAWPLAARAQQRERIRHIGILLAGTPTSFEGRAKAFVQGMEEFGYVEGKTVAFEWRWGEDRAEHLPRIIGVAAGLVHTLARPGGNATGFSIVAPDLSGKRL
jgi:putative ABC transport system substrate-binding protein